ncbi:hypothetical protein E2320_018823 [Naja naja]|nr:hypothetical protein E2320_018823 [Naja naja]
MWQQLLETVRSYDTSQQNVIAASCVMGGGSLLIYWLLTRRRMKTLEIGDGWWGLGEKPSRNQEDETIRPFQVKTSDEEIQDLYLRLDQTRYTPPLEGAAFHYGFNSNYLQKVVSYWRNQFDWQKQVKILNQYPHYKTTIEGYGFSEPPHQQGFDAIAAARIFHKLMQRLGFQEYYLQGLHINMIFISKYGWGAMLDFLLGPYVPWLVGLTREDARRMFPFFKHIYHILRESGYMHIQCTKPDTAGCGLNDSPVGLAAYILEKFSTWTDKSFLNMEDGNLERKYSLDELLTNVMIYWVTSSIVPSMRFYKENLSQDPSTAPDAKVDISVPTGIAAFPNELLHCPRSWAKKQFKNIVTYTYMPRGGHFAAFEEPDLLAQDIRQFVKKVEHLN